MRLQCLAFFGIVVTACGGSVANNTPSGPPADQFGAYVAKQFCAELAKCCDAAVAHFASAPYDEQACLTQMGPYWQRLVGPALATGRATYHPEFAEACAKVQASREAVCADDLLFPATARNAPDYSCAAMLSGSVQPGEACTEDGECAREPGLETSVVMCQQQGPSPSSGKVCVRLRYDRKIGETCDTRINHCDDSGQCSDAGVCVPFLKTGDSCVLYGPSCDMPNSYCDTVVGKCVAAAEAGDACSDTRFCNTGEVLDCDPKTHTCQQAWVPEDGQTCTQQNQCGVYQECAGDGFCITVGSNHIFDVSPRSCGFGPLSDGLESLPKEGTAK